MSDVEALDDLGLPRTTGPFATLTLAKAAAEAQREAGPSESPLATRRAGARSSAARSPAVTKRRSPKPSSAPWPAPPPRTWLDDLETSDPAAARRARATIEALRALGIGNPEDLVRRDALGGSPVVTERLLGVALRERVAAAIAEGDDGQEASAMTVGVLSAVLAVLAEDGPGGPLAGWELVERGTGRRLRPLVDDLG